MTHDVRRRQLLKGIGMGTIAVTAAGTVSAGGEVRYLVGSGSTSIASRLEREGYTVQRELLDGQVALTIGPEDAEDDIADVTGVKYVSRDFRLEIDTPEQRESTEDYSDDVGFFDLQWDKQVTDVERAHETATGESTSVAIIDTGTDFDHRELPNVDDATARLFRGGDVYSGTGSVEYPASVSDLSAGTTTRQQHVADDVLGHGTHVGGIAAANAGENVVGTAPDAEVVPLRVFWWYEDSDGRARLGATFGDILGAIEYAAAVDTDAMNLSIGTPPLPPQVNASGIRGVSELVIENAVRQGTAVVVSAGNSNADIQGGDFTWPSSMAGVVTISATGPNDERAFYSNYGTSEIDLGAPGGGYETLEKTLETDDDVVDWPFPTNLVLNAMDPDSLYGELLGGAEYLFLAGTSMAAPQVAGAAALVREVSPNSTAKQVESALKDGADLVEGQNDDELGAGRLNAADALE